MLHNYCFRRTSMEIGSKIKFAYNDTQGVRKQGVEILTSDILEKNIMKIGSIKQKKKHV